MNTTLDDIESYWQRELGEDVEIVPRGWVDYPADFALYLSGTFVVAYKHLEEVESWMERYMLVQGEDVG